VLKVLGGEEAAPEVRGVEALEDFFVTVGEAAVAEQEAREKLHYAKPGEVIYALPAEAQGQPTGEGK
jgi:cell division protein FtsB